MDKSVKNILSFFLLVLILYLFQVLSSILIPLVLAFLLASLFQPLVRLMKRTRIPGWLFLPTVAIITLGLLFGVFQMLSEITSDIISQQEYLLARLNSKIDSFVIWLDGIAGSSISNTINFNEIDKLFQQIDVPSLFGNIASSISSFTGSFFMFSLYFMVILTSLPNYKRFIHHVMERNDLDEEAENESKNNFIRQYEIILHSIISYINVKTFVSLATGSLTFLICWLFDIKFPFLWGFIAFGLNFIPTIGSIVAVLFPTLMAIIQFDSADRMLLVALILSGVQFGVGNLIEPIIMGNKLKINTLTVFIALFFWGFLWGIPGMFLAVPLIVIFKLVLEQFPSTAYIARVMGSSK
jgi:AI-2 transport protein TqsA